MKKLLIGCCCVCALFSMNQAQAQIAMFKQTDSTLRSCMQAQAKVWIPLTTNRNVILEKEINQCGPIVFMAVNPLQMTSQEVIDYMVPIAIQELDNIVARHATTSPININPEMATRQLGNPISKQDQEFVRGLQDRANWELWFNNLQGDYKTGAFYWSSQRSLSQPGSCNQLNIDFLEGCTDAKTRLTPTDIARKTSPAYRFGWNNYTETVR
jgi:hypothetical protein